jgi:hypothetical protein
LILYKLVGDDYRGLIRPEAIEYRVGAIVRSSPDAEHVMYPDGRLYFWDDYLYTLEFLGYHLRLSLGYKHLLECKVDWSEHFTPKICVTKSCRVLRELPVRI